MSDDFCIFDGYLLPDCSHLLWGLIDKMHSGLRSELSFTDESRADNEAHAEDYQELAEELGEEGVTISSIGTLLVNLDSDTRPLVDSVGDLDITDDLPEVDANGTLIL